MIDWTYCCDAMPPVRRDYASFERSLPKRFDRRAFAPVLFCADGHSTALPGFYFGPTPRDQDVFVTVIGEIYPVSRVYAWTPAPAAAPVLRRLSLARALSMGDAEFGRLLEYVEDAA